MEYTKEQIHHAKKNAGSLETLEYIAELETRLEQLQADLAIARAGQLVTDAANTMHGANLNELFTMFSALPRACNYTLELYWDGSGSIENNVPVNTLCSWEDLSDAKAAIERLSTK